MTSFRDSLAVYLDRRIRSIFVLGIMSGLPWVMIGSALSLWLKDAGLSRTNIGFAGFIYAVYSINFLWSPFIDKFRFSLFPNMGHRRSWIIICQSLIAISCLLMSWVDPSINAKTLVLFGLILAISSATQDIAIDAYRVDNFANNDDKGISAAAAAATAGWWTGYAALGFIPLELVEQGWSWPAVYVLMCVFTFCITVVTVFLPDPERVQQTESSPLNAFQDYQQKLASIALINKLTFGLSLLFPWLFIIWAVIGSPGLPNNLNESAFKVPCYIIIVLSAWGLVGYQLLKLSKVTPSHTADPDLFSTVAAWLTSTLIDPLQDFFKRNGVKVALGLLAFILLFKLGEAFLGRMSIVFYRDIGFTTGEIATYSKLVTGILTLVCIVPCGLLNAKFGIVRGLFISGIAMAASNLMFIWLAKAGPDTDILLATVIVDGFTQAWASVATVSFISKLCNHHFSATQYAVLASLGTLGRTTIATNSGLLVDSLNGDWSIFFVITTLMVIPGLTALYLLRPHLKNL